MSLWQTRIMSFLSIKQKKQTKLQYILQLYFCVLDHLTWQARKEYTQQQLLKTNLHLRVKKVGLEHQTIWAFITRLRLWGTKKKNQLNEMMVGRRLLRRWEYSCRSWRGAAGRCTRRSRRCSCTLAPSAWRRRRKHWSGTGWGRPAYSASPTNTKEVERQG